VVAGTNKLVDGAAVEAVPAETAPAASPAAPPAAAS
jgi:hypothetical protein